FVRQKFLPQSGTSRTEGHCNSCVSCAFLWLFPWLRPAARCHFLAIPAVRTAAHDPFRARWLCYSFSGSCNPSFPSLLLERIRCWLHPNELFMTIRRTSFSTVCLMLLASASFATTVERLGLEDLVKKARTIVVGKVAGSRTYWSADRKFILTDYTIQVDETIKGNAGRSVSVTSVGGKIGDIELRVSGMPAFQSGEDAVVFIEQSGAYQTVVGLAQGKFTVVNGEVANSAGGLSFPDGRPGNPVRMPLQSFKSQIRSFLSR